MGPVLRCRVADGSDLDDRAGGASDRASNHHLLFMVPLGIGMAATVRVGHAFGAATPGRETRGAGRDGARDRDRSSRYGDPDRVRFTIVRLFLGETCRMSMPTFRSQLNLLLIGGTFYIMDGLQASRPARCAAMNDTRMPLAFAAVSYWRSAFLRPMPWPSTPGSARPASGSASRSAASVYATLLVWRFRLLARRLERPKYERRDPPVTIWRMESKGLTRRKRG